MGFRTCAAVIIAKVLKIAPEIVKYNVQTELLSILDI
jgi:hypothetical protein